jgi:MATE family multidrug resistance protein
MSESIPSPRPVEPGGYGEVLRISVPLILSTSSLSLMHVIDRVFLSWYSPDALAASLPAGAASWALLSLFVGTTSYVSTFVSQYDGAKRPHRIGPAVWQGIYFSLLAMILAAWMSKLAGPIFRFAGHPAEILQNEIDYFRILMIGAGGPILSATLSSFYSGRGKTWTVMWVNIGGMALNAVLDYCWVFGYWGFPEWGISGAAWASVVAAWAMAVAYFVLMALPHNRKEYGTYSSFRFEKDLFLRLLRFGVPSGMQWCMDITAFTFFILLVGRIGDVELGASNIAIAINHLLFMPLVGLSIGTSVLVGRYLGEDNPDLSARATYHSFHLAAGYMAAFGVLLVLFPNQFVAIFDPGSGSGDFEEIARITRNLLYFVAAYSVLDSANIVFSSALKGAGDTKFVFLIALLVSSCVLVLPVYYFCVVRGYGIYTAWVILSVWVMTISVAFWWRFKVGKWRSMRVIEHAPSPGAAVVEGPVVDA